MQDDSNLRWPPKQAYLPKKNVFIQIQDYPPETKSLQRKIFYY